MTTRTYELNKIGQWNFSFSYGDNVQEMCEIAQVDSFIILEENGYYGGYSDSEPIRSFINCVFEAIHYLSSNTIVGYGGHESFFFAVPNTQAWRNLASSWDNEIYTLPIDSDESTLKRDVYSILDDIGIEYTKTLDSFEGNEYEFKSLYSWENDMLTDDLENNNFCSEEQIEAILSSDDNRVHDALSRGYMMDNDVIAILEDNGYYSIVDNPRFLSDDMLKKEIKPLAQYEARQDIEIYHNVSDEFQTDLEHKFTAQFMVFRNKADNQFFAVYSTHETMVHGQGTSVKSAINDLDNWCIVRGVSFYFDNPYEDFDDYEYFSINTKTGYMIASSEFWEEHAELDNYEMFEDMVCNSSYEYHEFGQGLSSAEQLSDDFTILYWQHSYKWSISQAMLETGIVKLTVFNIPQ